MATEKAKYRFSLNIRQPLCGNHPHLKAPLAVDNWTQPDK
jgi:hypothetical protein